MYPGVLIPEYTDSEVLEPTCGSTLKGINAVLRRDRGQVPAPAGDFSMIGSTEVFAKW
jgi:hypothetical protein